MSTAILAEFNAERERQIKKGFTPEHDAEEHANGALTLFAAVLACPGAINASIIPPEYQWTCDAANKHTDMRERLVMAGAVLMAEIERIDALALTSADKV